MKNMILKRFSIYIPWPSTSMRRTPNILNMTANISESTKVNTASITPALISTGLFIAEKHTKSTVNKIMHLINSFQAYNF